MDNHDARVSRLQRALAAIYAVLQRLLTEVPQLPIEVPPLGETAEGHRMGIDALDRARALLDEQPMADDLRLAMQSVILEWVTLYERMAIVEELGGSDLRLDITERAAARATLYLDKVRELIDYDS